MADVWRGRYGGVGIVIESAVAGDAAARSCGQGENMLIDCEVGRDGGVIRHGDGGGGRGKCGEHQTSSKQGLRISTRLDPSNPMKIYTFETMSSRLKLKGVFLGGGIKFKQPQP